MPALSPGFGVNGYNAWLGLLSNMSNSNFDLDSAFSFGVSGDCMSIRFESPISQSSGTLKVWARLIAVTGSPTSISCAIHAGPTGAEDDDRPSSTQIAKATINCSAASANSWIEFSFTGVSLTANSTYWLLFYNETGTPASNFVSLRSASLNAFITSERRRFTAYTSIDGFAGDPTVSGLGSVVVKFADNSYYGNAYVVGTAHANNSNIRGGRWTFPQAIKIAGLHLESGFTEGFAIKLYQGATLLEDITLNRNLGANGGMVWFSVERTLAANTAYDVVIVPTGNSNVVSKFDAGTSPPADVSAALIPFIQYVDGTTPGSLTATEGAPGGIILIPAGLASRQSAHVFG